MGPEIPCGDRRYPARPEIRDSPGRGARHPLIGSGIHRSGAWDPLSEGARIADRGAPGSRPLDPSRLPATSGPLIEFRWGGHLPAPRAQLRSQFVAIVGAGLATTEELQIVSWVAELVHREHGMVAGQATERDGSDGSGLTIDFTFEGADPRFAVEVTSLRTDFETPSEKDLRRFKARLTRFANQKNWPHWSVGVRPETKLKSKLGPAVERIMEWMLAANLDTLGPAFYSHDVPLDLCSGWERPSCKTATGPGWRGDTGSPGGGERNPGPSGDRVL